MDNFDILHLLKNGVKIRKKNWKKGWYLFINTVSNDEFNIESFTVDYSSKMKDDLSKTGDQFSYKTVIEDLIYEKWETYRDDRN